MWLKIACFVYNSNEFIAHLSQQKSEEMISSLIGNETISAKVEQMADVINSEAQRPRPPAQRLVIQTHLAHLFGH